MTRSHSGCWTGTEYNHTCAEPSGRACHDCGKLVQAAIDAGIEVEG